MESRWHRDIEVSQLIDHMRQDDKRDKDGSFSWARLTKAEEAAAVKEAVRCRNDFVYAARNYFWITNKNLEDQLLTLNEAQEIILHKLLEIKAKNKPQKLIIVKGRQLGCSTLIEALIAWRTMFFANVHAIVVSYDRGHVADALFPIMTTILDKMPWWLKPMVASRRLDEGLHFHNPRHDQRDEFPGLDSRVLLKAANSTTAVGAGVRLSAAHISEFCLFEPSVAQKIIDQEMRHALIDDVNTFAILESTGRGANNYTHKLWKNCVARAERADWYPLFLPAFFEKRRATTPPPNWRIEMPEHRMRLQVMDAWVKCNNAKCSQYYMRWRGTEDRSEEPCPSCETGVLHPYSLTDAQCCFMEDARKNAAHDDESLKKWRQELAITAQDAFQVEGYQVFGAKAQDFADSCIRQPIAVGDYDAMGFFHGVNNENPRWIEGQLGKFKGCYQADCTLDHNPEWNECPLKIWEWPVADAHYCMGCDVAEGLGGKAAYSAAVMIRYSLNNEPNYQVATWRSNTIDPISYAGKLNSFGRAYNDAMAAVEINKFDSCMTALRMNMQYPNLYRWKHMDSIRPESNKLGWETNMKSRPRLWMTLRIWLEQGLVEIRSENICNEMRNFVKNALDDAYASGDQGEPDDELMACHPKGVLIRTSDGVRPIEEVRVGDMVLTHMGRFMPVVATNCRHKHDKVYRVKITSKQDLLITGNHRIYLWEKWKETSVGSMRVSWSNYRDPKWISINEAPKPLIKYGTCYPIRNETIDREFIDLVDYLPATKELVECDGFIGFAKGGKQHSGRMKHVKRHLPVDKNLCRLLGYYLAEGGKGSHNLIFASHEREEPLRAWLSSYLRSLGLSPGLRAHSPHGRLIWATSTVFHAFFSQFGVKNFKRLPSWTEYLPIQKQRDILIGYLLGDGCFRRASGSIQSVTVSATAAHQLLDMSLRCGWCLRFTHKQGQNGNLSQWVMEWSSSVANEIKRLIEPELLECKRPFSRTTERNSEKVKLRPNHMVSQIKEVKEVEHDGPVYNLEVAEDNSYVANGTVVHNCQIALFCANENLYHAGLGLVAPRNTLTDDTAKFFVLCKQCGHRSKEVQVDRDQLNPMLSQPMIDPSGAIRKVGGMKCRACGGFQLEISTNPIASEDQRTEADRLIADLNPAQLPPELDPNTWELPTYDSL